MNTTQLNVKCQTQSCSNLGTVFNVITYSSQNKGDLDMFIESFGHGSEDEYDTCPVCLKLGLLEEA